MVEFPQTSVLQLWMPCKNFWSLLLLLFSPTLCSLGPRISRLQPLFGVSQLTTIMAFQAATQVEKLRKGTWDEEEDELLITFVTLLGDRRWDYIARASGLRRSGKSCRLRWLNYLNPNIKHGDISTEEEQIILQLHRQWGNKWSKIAQRLPGRTDNEIKNYWRTHLRKRVQAQQEEKFQCGRNNAEQDFLLQKVDFDVQKYDTDDKKHVEDTSGTGNTSFDAIGISNFGYTFSPYETRLLDWMTELSSDESKITLQDDSNSADFSYQARISNDTDAWGWSGSIWDMN